jgi:hypothetical protein
LGKKEGQMAIQVGKRSALIWVVLPILFLLGITPVWGENPPDKDQILTFFQQGQEQLKAYHFKEAEVYFITEGLGSLYALSFLQRNMALQVKGEVRCIL